MFVRHAQSPRSHWPDSSQSTKGPQPPSKQQRGPHSFPSARPHLPLMHLQALPPSRLHFLSCLHGWLEQALAAAPEDVRTGAT